MIPARLTVAGVAKRRSRISKSMRMCGFKGMRSFEARVSILLSSITEFMDSIQLASRSPTKAEAETKRIVKQDSILNRDESNKATIVAKSLQAN
mmetsp:Transcript_29475/g.95503  ORF Transcript_29475/g.95503 Transcript_29475/m.95503 type:complete len:94 (+) Transcript_29475:672-953(+)